MNENDVGFQCSDGAKAGADGLMIEVHPQPDQALSDGAQSLTFDQFAELTPRTVLPVIAAAGYRASDDSSALAAKVRFDDSQVIEHR